MRKYLFIIILIVGGLQTKAQYKLSPKATISVITCGPGSELFSAFGHNAIRLQDPVLGIDKVYNYGTFDFNAPNFYLNFAKGKLIYQLSASDFKYFIYTYQYEKRWVKSQLLNLESNDVQSLYNFLENNAKPVNSSYQYDFFFDNCSTKIEEVLKAVLKQKVSFPNEHIQTSKTHRDLIADYTSKFKWGKFGIDLALGSVIDRETTTKEYKFLPDYIALGLEHAAIFDGNDSEPLVLNEKIILQEENKNDVYSFLSPSNIFLLISLLLAFITYKNFKTGVRTRWVDFVLYFTTGLIGIIVLLLWFATNHTSTYKNFNFLWAFAPNLMIAFYMLKTTIPKWVEYYNKLLILLLGLMLILWLSEVQVFNSALIPLIIALGLRYGYLISSVHSIKSRASQK